LRVEVVVPVRNERQSLDQFIQTLEAQQLGPDVDLGLTFVEDSSTDGTREFLQARAAADPRITLLALEEGRGQGPAVYYGVKHARADAIVMMDGDGSHPIDAIPRMVDGYRKGWRVVQCRRLDDRTRPRLRAAASTGFQLMCRLLTGFDLAQQNIYFRLVGSEVAVMMLRHPAYWRLLRFPFANWGVAVHVIDVPLVERTAGSSTYNLLRLSRLAADALLGLIPVTRFAAASASMLVLGVIACARGHYSRGLLVLLGLCSVVWRFSRLHSGSYLNALRSIDSPLRSGRG
jgi:dolichol-phosphate mannosyltransferase